MQRLPKKELPDPVLKPALKRVLGQRHRKMWSMPISRMWVRNNHQQSLSQKGEAKTLAFFVIEQICVSL